jgi:hypothetical protein
MEARSRRGQKRYRVLANAQNDADLEPNDRRAHDT